MIKQEFIFLGMLREGPKHGYEIKKRIKEIPSLFAGVNLKSIYYPLTVLEKEGLILRHSDKKGKRPERMVYALTQKGQNRFNELLSRSFLDFKRPQFSLDLSLYFLHYMNAALAKRRLRARTMILKKLAKNLSYAVSALKNQKSFPLARILEHNLKMVEAESKFLSELKHTL